MCARSTGCLWWAIWATVRSSANQSKHVCLDKSVVVPPTPPEKVELQEIKVLDDMLSTGNINEKLVREMARKEVPVVGYNGFVKSIKSENMYGAPFKDLASKSIYS